jgi:hypothetical protein
MTEEKKPPKATSADVLAALVLRYPAESHALMFEVAPRTGGGTRYADAVAVGLWASHGHAIEGFEVKVARADWLNELKQPQKSDPVAKYCNRWWLACTPGVAAPAELPVGWGMLELQSAGTLRIKVQAPPREPQPVTLGFFASLIRRGAEPDNAVIQALVQREAKAYAQRFQEDRKKEQRREISHQHEQAEKALSLIAALKERTGVDLLDYKHGEDWFRAVDTFHALGSEYGRGALKGLLDDLQAAIAAIRKSGLVPESAA